LLWLERRMSLLRQPIGREAALAVRNRSTFRRPQECDLLGSDFAPRRSLFRGRRGASVLGRLRDRQTELEDPPIGRLAHVLLPGNRRLALILGNARGGEGARRGVAGGGGV